MMIRTKLLIAANKLFRAPIHPFNMQSCGIKTYAQWQYERGADTIAFFLEKYTAAEMFADKTVADIGCGAAGKSLYYAAGGAKKVIGVEILEKYCQEAQRLAADLGLSDKFEFVCANAAQLPFESGSIDTVIMNDAMEHVEDPEGTLQEILRVLKKGGRLYVNFPPYHHPFGAHLSDAIHIPWVHMLFSEKVLVQAYKRLVARLPDADERIRFRIAKKPDNTEYFSYINHMTIKRFKKILNKLHILPAYYYEAPLRRVLQPLCKIAGVKEMFVKMVVCVIEK